MNIDIVDHETVVLSDKNQKVQDLINDTEKEKLDEEIEESEDYNDKTGLVT